MPSTTLMAVSSSIAYAGIRQAGGPLFCGCHGVLRQSRMIHVREDREVDDSQRSVPTVGRVPDLEVLADPRGHHHAPGAQADPDRVSAKARGRPGPTRRMWWARYRESPPFTSRTSVSSTRGTQAPSRDVGSAVSSSTPRDFHPSSHMGVVACPVMNRYAPRMPPGACPYDAVGMQRASHSAIGLPSSSSIASLNGRRS